VVEKNNSLNKAIDVSISEENKSTILKAGDVTIVEATKVSEEKAIVTKIDLRPIGLNIYGDTDGLCVGTNKLTSNTFMNVHTMVGIGQ